MTATTLHIEPADDRRAAAAAATLAALPLSFVETERRGADVVVVSGAEGWVGRTRHAAEAGARGIIVTDPVAEDDALTLVADPPAATIVLSEPWASSPVLLSAVESWGARIARSGLVDARAVEPLAGRSLRAVLFAQLRAVQSLGVEVSSLSVTAESPTSLLAVGRSATGARIALSAGRSATSAGSLDLLLVGREETIRLELPAGLTARPGRAVLTSADDGVELPTTWETAHRTAWITLRDALLTGGRVDDVVAFARAVEVQS